MLPVSIHRNDRGASGCTESGGQCRLVAKIPREPDTVDLRDFLPNGKNLFPGAVGTSIVDHDDLVKPAAECAVHIANDAAEGQPLVVGGHDDADGRARDHAVSRLA